MIMKGETMGTLKWLLVLAIPAVWMGTAWSQEDQIVPEGTTVSLLLLRQKSVQQELKLGDDMAKKVMEFTNKQSDAVREVMKEPKEEQKPKLEAMEKENKKFLMDNLTKEQHKRLDQIAMQFTGLHQLTRPEVIQALNLNEEQIEKIKELQKEGRKELVKIIYDKNSKDRSQRYAELRQETRAKVQALLTNEQWAKIREMVGKPFMGEIVFEDPEPEKD
jgi:hypothetical protein